MKTRQSRIMSGTILAAAAAVSLAACSYHRTVVEPQPAAAPASTVVVPQQAPPPNTVVVPQSTPAPNTVVVQPPAE